MINVDVMPYGHVDVVCDVVKDPLPFNKDQFVYVRVWMLLEHLRDWEVFLYKLRPYCRDGCVIDIKVPYYNSASMVGSYQHVRWFGYKPFEDFANTENELYKKKLWECSCTYLKPSFVGKFIPGFKIYKDLSLRTLCSFFVGNLIHESQSSLIVKK
jgi:hypothetical protein